eukprot:CAMPEP_0205906630 /NCGR_PEP_ID=MMETSP1325-20131115/2053_1 /ASSEMBLY_ACC=CAM_ASM_000708 /TAXON_ID=236786 /ORGANISM="Florenciella sp., Strain RCC1007" /LENGTH=125 /DNA_ID=CAMNT_0053272655 /DNA_START=14 /DNA_END=391 /DNA_ORIENTATION=+
MTDENSLCSKAAYAITWENYNPGNFYIPLENQKQYTGAMEFFNSGKPMLQHDMTWHGAARGAGYFTNTSQDDYGVSDTTTSVSSNTSTSSSSSSSRSSSSGDDDSQASSSSGHSSSTSCGKGCMA